jgi:hypothetical protein
VRVWKIFIIFIIFGEIKNMPHASKAYQIVIFLSFNGKSKPSFFCSDVVLSETTTFEQIYDRHVPVA